MFKIGEFSKLTQVSIRMLRYYDEVGLLKPAQIDPDTNYRLYDTGQIVELNKIVFLRDLGFGVSDIADALIKNKWQDSYITDLLERKRQEIEGYIQLEQQKLSKIELAKRDILQEKIAYHYNVTIKAIPGCQVFSLRRVVPSYYAEGALWKEMKVAADAKGVRISNHPFTIYHDKDYRESDVDIEICAPVVQMGEDFGGFTYRAIAPVPVMGCTMVYGPFENIAGAYQNFAAWLQEHSRFRMGESSRQIVHRGPWNEQSKEQYLTEIQIPLNEIKRGVDPHTM